MAIGFGTGEGVGTTDRIQTPLTGTSSERTFAIWAYRTGAGGNNIGRMIYKDGEFILFTTTTKYRFSKNFTTNDGKWDVPKPADDVWVRVLVTYDQSSLSNDPGIYFDGVSQSVNEEEIPSGTLETNTNPVFIGNADSSDRVWDGRLGEASIWHRILTLEEIQADALFTPDNNLQSLVMYNSMVRGGTIDKIGGLCTVTGTAHQDHPRVIRPSAVPYLHVVSSAGPTVTAPATATSGSSAAIVGTNLSGTAVNIIDSNGGTRAQTVTATTATTATVNPTDTGEFDLRTLGAGSSAVSGVAYSSVDVSAAGITAYTTQWQAVNSGTGVFSFTVSAAATLTVVQLMTTGDDAAITTGQSLASSALVAIENNHQIVGPKAINGMNLTYSANGDLTGDKDQTETDLFLYYAPSTKNWSILQLTINQTGVVSGSIVRSIVKNINQDIVRGIHH